MTGHGQLRLACHLADIQVPVIPPKSALNRHFCAFFRPPLTTQNGALIDFDVDKKCDTCKQFSKEIAPMDQQDSSRNETRSIKSADTHLPQLFR